MDSQLLIGGDNFDKIRKDIRGNKEKKIIFTSDNDELNKKVLEKENIDFLLLSQSSRKDFLKQRNSGFNHVLAKLAKKSNVGIGINFDEIVNSTGLKKSEILARVGQNIRLCNKNKIKMKFISFRKENERNIHDLKALGLVLGMPTWMTKNL